MPESAGWLLAPATLAIVLAVAAVAKLRAVESTYSVLLLLRLPKPLADRRAARAIPWVEAALAVLLVATPSGPAYVAVASGSLIAFAGYWVVVARALRFDPRPACGCFGRIGDQRIRPRTLVRNSLYLGLAAVTLALATAGRSVPGLLAGGDRADLVWLGAVVASGVTLTLSFVPLPGRVRRQAAEPDPLDYQRTPIPDVHLLDGDRSRSLRELTRERALLIVVVAGLDPEIVARLGDWEIRLPAIDVRAVQAVVGDHAPTSGGALVDPGGGATTALGCEGVPCAVLLGADGLLAGGPETGWAEIDSFVSAIETELSGLPAASN